MSQDTCFNCFRLRDGETGPCPHCGYDPAADQGKYPFALPHGSILAGQFITGRVLGQGGFGITYLAQDKKLDIKVAIKEFLPDSMAVRSNGDHQVTVYTGQRQENFRYGMDRFLDEARVLAKFQGNPHIVGVRSYFEENGTAYFVMDYIEGESFKTYIQNKGGKVSWQEAVRVLTPVMDALSAVHKEGIIHRDVTPDNIVLTSDGGVKLLDFGSARYSLGDKSKSLDVVLKAGYAPKEQYIRRGKQGPYTDIYSLAACFYAAITGYLPPEALERMDEDDLVPPSTRGIKLPSGFEDVILKGLEVQPADRYQSMEEFRMALDETLVEKDAPDQAAGPIPNRASESAAGPKPTAEPTSAATSDPIPEPAAVADGAEKTSLLERIKTIPKAAKGGIAAAACFVIIFGALAGSGVFSRGRPSPAGSGSGGSVQNSGTLQRTAQDGGIGQLEAPEEGSPEDGTAPEGGGNAANGESTPVVNTTTTDESDKAASDKAAADKAAADKAAADKAAADKAAADKAAADKAAADKAAADKAAADKAAADKAAADKAAADKAAADKAAADKAAADKAAADKAAADKAAADKAAADKAAADKAAADKAAAEPTSVNNKKYTLKTASGEYEGTYTGEWKDGKPNGQGTFSRTDTKWTYTGDFVAGVVSGHGEMIFASGDKYVGDLKNGVYDGSGVYNFHSGARYEGSYKNGQRNGEGKYTFDDGSYYNGEFKDGSYHGYGVRVYSSGDRYEGEWKDDKRNGYGVYTFANGGRFEGNYSNGKREGEGTLYKADGTIDKKGTWKDGEFVEPEVPAVTKVTNESYTMVTSKFSVSGTYTGEWKDGKPNGEGTMTMTQSDERWDKGDTLYSANWVNGLIEGYGQWRSAVDGAYDGNFSKGLKSGKGKMWFSDGTVYDGQWSGGDFLG